MIISSSGIRGIAFNDLKPDIVARFAISYARVITPDSVVIGTDCRPSSSVFKRAVIAGLLSEGVRVIDLGICPTPTVFYAVRRLNASGAIVITGSHNPIEWNAIKFADDKGTFIREGVMNKIVREYKEMKTFKIGYKVNEINKSKVIKVNITEDYINHLLNSIDYFSSGKYNVRDIKVVVDPAAGAAIHVTPHALKIVGFNVLTVNADPENPFRDYEPSERTLKYIKEVVKGSHIGLAHDSDADRLVLITNEGRVLSPDYTLAVVIKAIYDDGLVEVKGGKVVVNIASSRLIEDVVEEYGGKVVYCDVGERKVLDRMISENANVGGEGSCGGVIIRDINPTRDGILAALIVTGYLAKRGKKLSEIIEDMPRYIKFNEKIYVKDQEAAQELVNKIAEALNGQAYIRLGGVKVIFDDGSWILFRPSGTEPLVRIIGETKEESRLHELKKYAKELVSSIVEGVKPGVTRVFSSNPIRER